MENERKNSSLNYPEIDKEVIGKVSKSESSANTYFDVSKIGTSGVSEEVFRTIHTIRTSNQLLSNMGRTQNQQLSLELYPPMDGEGSPVSKDIYTQELAYTPEEEKLIFALMSPLWEAIDKNEDLKEYISKLTPLALEDRRETKGSPLPSRVPVVVDITSLARDRYGIPSGKVENKLKKRLYSVSETGRTEGELAEMSLRRKTFTLRRGDKTLTLRAPLITIGKDVSIRENGVVKKTSVEVLFEDVFLMEIVDKYSLLPRDYPILRQKYGNDTEVFRIIEKRLLLERGVKVKTYNKDLENLKKKAEKDKLQESELSKSMENLRGVLEVHLSERNIVVSLDSKTYYKDSGKKHLNRAKVLSDVEKAAAAFKGLGLISEYRLDKTSDGGNKFIFVLNEKWINE